MGTFALAYENGISIGEAISVSITGFVVVLLILALLSVLVLILSKGIRLVESSAGNRKKKKGTEEPQKADAAPSATGTPLPENTSAGNLVTVDVDEKTAATIMAIVSHESGIPLNRLQFKSIKRIEK